jgi:hypothetical protein
VLGDFGQRRDESRAIVNESSKRSMAERGGGEAAAGVSTLGLSLIAIATEAACGYFFHSLEPSRGTALARISTCPSFVRRG